MILVVVTVDLDFNCSWSLTNSDYMYDTPK